MNGSTSWRKPASCSRPSGSNRARATTASSCSRSATVRGSRTTRAISRAGPGRAPTQPLRLLPRGLPGGRRRVPCDGAADRRHVRGGPLAQADPRRLRLPAALGARQPPHALRRVGGARPPRHLRQRHAGPLRTQEVGGRGDRPHQPAHGPPRPGRRGTEGNRPGAGPHPRDQGDRGARRSGPGDDAHQAHGRRPPRAPPGDGGTIALPALRGPDLRARRDPPEPPAGEVRRGGGGEPPAGRARPPRGVPGGDPRRGQGGIPALGDLSTSRPLRHAARNERERA